MCRSKCLKASTFDLGKDPSLILETEGSWEVLEKNLSIPSCPPWGARISWGIRQVVIENGQEHSSSHPWSLGMLGWRWLTLGFTSGLRARIKYPGCLEQPLGTLSFSQTRSAPRPPVPVHAFSVFLDYRREDLERNFPAVIGAGAGVLARGSCSALPGSKVPLGQRSESSAGKELAQRLQGDFAFPSALRKLRVLTVFAILLFMPAPGSYHSLGPSTPPPQGAQGGM